MSKLVIIFYNQSSFLISKNIKSALSIESTEST